MIAERAEQLEEEQKELQKINNKVFDSFCKELGISDITEYEGGSLAEVKERQEKLNRLAMLVGFECRLPPAKLKVSACLHAFDGRETSVGTMP